MRHYETVLITRPNIPDGDLDTLIEKVKGDLESKGSLHEYSLHKWGKRSLAYPIEKTKEGVFFIMNYETEDGNCVDAMEKKLRINDQVLRFLTVRQDDDMRTEGKLRDRFQVKEAPRSIIKEEIARDAAREAAKAETLKMEAAKAEAKAKAEAEAAEAEPKEEVAAEAKEEVAAEVKEEVAVEVKEEVAVEAKEEASTEAVAETAPDAESTEDKEGE